MIDLAMDDCRYGNRIDRIDSSLIGLVQECPTRPSTDI